jgi:Leucine-rich repeat (LRR) protein
LLLVTADCPGHCQCSKYKIRCSGVRLNGLPNITSTTEELIIMQDNITELSATLYSEVAYKKLHTLHFDSTNTTDIGDDMFKHMYYLKILAVTHDKIYKIPVGTFQDLRNLSKLNLSGNKLRILNSRMFEGLEISDLDFSYNGIISLPHDLFFGMRHINNCKQTADMSHTHLPLHTLQTHSILNFSHNIIDYITPGIFQGLCVFTSLDLSSNILRTLEPSTFVGLTGLKSLDLRINMITRLQAGSFKGLNSVEQIKLTSYVSTYIDQDGRSILDILHLGGQNFRDGILSLTRQHLKSQFLGMKKHFLEGPGLNVIEEDAFRNLSLLHDLELSTNCIRNISNKMLHGLSSLRILRLNQTCLQMLELYTFKEFSCLLELDLSVNRIEVLFSSVFQGLMKLRTLNLGFNKIHTVQSEAFSGLIHLHALDMIGNNIPRITKGMFKELVMLRALNLPYNNRTTIESDAFKGLTFLKYLNLAVNKVSSISNENFHTLKRLVYLDLTRNSELVIQLGALQSLQVMKTVGLTVKQDTNFMEGVTSVLQGLLQGVYSVQEMSLMGLDIILPPAAFVGFHISSLDLSNNYIPLLKCNTFSGLSSLRILKLNWNKLRTITVGAFRHLHTLTFLTLTNNEISSLLAGVFQGLTSLETLLLYDNELSSLEEGVFGAVCRKLTYPPYDIPVSGEAYHNSCCEAFNSLSSLQHLDLSLNKLKYIHPHTFICNVQLLTLKLSFNLMLSLDTNFLFIPSLRELEMLFCNITKLSNDTFKWTPKLSKLDLVRNKIRTVDVESLKQFVKLELLYIHDNPLVCDCKLQETWYWLHRHRTAYYDGTFCVLENSS